MMDSADDLLLKKQRTLNCLIGDSEILPGSSFVQVTSFIAIIDPFYCKYFSYLPTGKFRMAQDCNCKIEMKIYTQNKPGLLEVSVLFYLEIERSGKNGILMATGRGYLNPTTNEIKWESSFMGRLHQGDLLTLRVSNFSSIWMKPKTPSDLILTWFN